MLENNEMTAANLPYKSSGFRVWWVYELMWQTIGKMRRSSNPPRTPGCTFSSKTAKLGCSSWTNNPCSSPDQSVGLGVCLNLSSPQQTLGKGLALSHCKRGGMQHFLQQLPLVAQQSLEHLHYKQEVRGLKPGQAAFFPKAVT